MPLEIPKKAEKPLEVFIGFPEERAKSFVTALNAASPSLLISDLAASVAEKSGLTKEQTAEILGVFAGLHLARSSAQKELPEFIEDVCKALRENKENDKLQPPNWESFKSNLTNVLSAENSLGVTAKAIDVMTAHEHVFQYARIVTDVRPIFATDAHERPSAAVLIHMLNVFYRNLGSMEQLCLALDSNDLKQLKRVIERAEAKEATLKALLKSDKLICLEGK